MNMTFKLEITEEEYNRAIAKGVASILDEKKLLGYGCTQARVFDENDKFYLEYGRGSNIIKCE